MRSEYSILQKIFKERKFHLEIKIFDLSIDAIDHPKFNASNQKEESISA